MTRRNATLSSLGVSIVFALAATSAHAQSSIGGGKSVTFPITITKSGSYKLAKDLNVPAGLDGIVVAPGVDANIDLAGFTITGGANCGKNVNCYQFNGTVGIRIDANQTLRVSNGHVRGFNSVGVGQASGFNWGQVIAKDLKLTGNAIGLRAYLVMAENVFAMDNEGSAISAETGSVINSVAASNGAGIGVSMGTIRGCIATSNTNYGFSFQRTAHQDNATFNSGTPTQGGGSYSPGFNNAFND